MPKKIKPARSPMRFSRLVEFTAETLEMSMRRHGGLYRHYLFAWPSFAVNGKVYPGRVDVIVGDAATVIDPYSDHRKALPIVINPPNAARWEAVPYRALAQRIREALRNEPILGSDDPHDYADPQPAPLFAPIQKELQL